MGIGCARHPVPLRLATATVLPEPDLDEAPLVAALRAAGFAPAVLAWDDPAVDWEAPVPTLIRSTWNYPHRPGAFLRWARRVERAAPLWHPAAVVRWNLHKRYLLELQARGVPVVPSVLLSRGCRPQLGELLAGRGWNAVVIKPAVSAASLGTRRFGLESGSLAFEAAQAHLQALLARGDALVQPYLPAVERGGERGLVWIDGEFTHAVYKAPRFAGEPERTRPAAIEPAERELAARALAAVPAAELLYARVDLVRDESGRPCVMELELIEPSLFFAAAPHALERLVRALGARLRRPPRARPEGGAAGRSGYLPGSR
ncbi:MAG: ATP-grasp domain-containing protein [Planctomycetota bacterium]|nr:MAG: ATP-grasp domain-containing protein [Planctomycetota bacterium]